LTPNPPAGGGSCNYLKERKSPPAGGDIGVNNPKGIFRQPIKTKITLKKPKYD